MLSFIAENVGNFHEDERIKKRFSRYSVGCYLYIFIFKVFLRPTITTWHSWLTFYGNMLRERRKELNLTQKQLAEKLDREQSYIARVENGKADIQLSSFFRIAAVLGIQFIPTYVN